MRLVAQADRAEAWSDLNLSIFRGYHLADVERLLALEILFALYDRRDLQELRSAAGLSALP